MSLFDSIAYFRLSISLHLQGEFVFDLMHSLQLPVACEASPAGVIQGHVRDGSCLHLGYTGIDYSVLEVCLMVSVLSRLSVIIIGKEKGYFCVL